VHGTRRPRYASPHGLGQAFNFDLLETDWDIDQFRRIITKNLDLARKEGASTTWVLSNHDVVRHATRYGLPPEEGKRYQDGKSWLLSSGTKPELDKALGLRRARAATLLMLALPGSAYLYQGEELGLHEVGDLPEEVLEDPTLQRSGGVEKGRDGCRVPLPWTSDGSALGFSTGVAHLPQPDWFRPLSVEAQREDADSTLVLYRRALGWRHRLPTSDELEWQDPGIPEVLHFTRPCGWHCVTNVGSGPVALPDGGIVVASGPLAGDSLPTDTTAWVLET
jgi:alpha-glucosidase